jgi:hypothetical protein
MAATGIITPAETTFEPHAHKQTAPPTQVATYRLIRPIGTGGMGTVYEAEDSDFGRRVALKLIAADSAASHEAVERFRQEGRLASTISHPRCVFVLAADEADGRPYIVMELMPGDTLQTMVEKQGPLPIQDAILKILDVVEGLREAHSLGVIHRDVKPSNCFLEPEGRVKVGDFGLAKSLAVDANLTRTRTFVGTPLYASPEQIKGERLDARTDVYSTAATLYYLLSGRPPFFEGDAAAILARIVSEPAPLLRTLRPEIPAALEAAVARGLERDRDRRWRNMAEFRAALLPLVPSQLDRGRVRLRALAFLIDCALFPALIELGLFVTLLFFGFDAGKAIGTWRKGLAVTLGLTGVAWVPYFTLLEGIWGRSVGKRLAGLQVLVEVGGGPPGLFRSFIRTGVVFLFFGLPADLALWLLAPDSLGARLLVFVTAAGAGALAMGAFIWLADRERGPQDRLSGTRVVRSERSARRRAPRARRAGRSVRAAPLRVTGVLETVGPYRIRGAVRWDGPRRVLLGEDSTLGRQVWIELRPRGAPAPGPARRLVSRPTRPRWLVGGDQADGRWDAYLPPTGCPLADLAGRDGLPWHEARPILHDLAGELAASCADQSLPEVLSVDQVWVEPDGGVQLVDILSQPAAAPRAASASDAERALQLLRETAALALEGGRRRSGAPIDRIAAPVPGHASVMLERLLGRGRPYESVRSFVEDLEASRELPDAVDAGRRALQIGIASAALFPGVAMLAVLSYQATALTRLTVALIVAWPLAWVVWALMTRGGFAFRLAGIIPVRADGQTAGRLRCAWRTLLVWGPIVALLLGSIQVRAEGFLWFGRLLWGVPLAILPVYAVLAILQPARSPLDYLAGTYQVPR